MGLHSFLPRMAWYEVFYTYADPTTGCSNSDTVSIYLDGCLGLPHFSISAPELATLVGGKQYLIRNIDSDFEGSVVDSKGQKVMHLVNQSNIDLEQLAVGIYFIHISAGNREYTFKVSRY